MLRWCASLGLGTHPNRDVQLLPLSRSPMVTVAALLAPFCLSVFVSPRRPTMIYNVNSGAFHSFLAAATAYVRCGMEGLADA